VAFHGYQWRDRKLSDFIKNIFISVLKMNESLTKFWNDMMVSN